MPCEVIKTSGGTAIACSRGQRRQRCSYCSNWAPYLCDFFVGITNRPCDRPICEDHRVKIGVNVDHCKVHGEAKKT